MDKIDYILGYKPSKAQIAEMLMRAKQEGVTLAEVASRYSMPELYNDFENTGYITTKEDGRISLEEFKTKHPHKKIVVLHSRIE